MAKMYGYMRVSTEDQNYDLQRDALMGEGVDPGDIFEDKISSKKKRPGLEELFELLQPGDTILVWKLDRLGRSTVDLLTLIDRIAEKKANLVSLNDTDFDTSTPTGKMIFTVVAAFANFERDMIGLRTKEGIKAYRRKNPGKGWGRQPAFDEEQARSMFERHKEGYSLRQIADMFDETSHSTVQRHIDRVKEMDKMKEGVFTLL